MEEDKGRGTYNDHDYGFYLVFKGSVHKTELNWTMVLSILWLWLPKFGAIPVAGCQVSKLF